MKKLIFKSCLLLAASAALVACNKDGEDLSPPTVEQEEQLFATLQNSVDQSRLSDLGSPSFAELLSSLNKNLAYSTSVVSAPSIPADAESIVGRDMSYNVSASSSFYLPEGESFDGQIMFSQDVNYYIAGDLTLSYWGADSSCTLYVLEGGSVTLPAQITNLTIKSWGELTFVSDFEIVESSALYSYSATPINTGSHDLDIRGTFYSASTVYASSVLCSGHTYNDVDITFDNCLFVENDFYAENYANIYLNSGLQSESVTLDSYAKIYLQENTLVQTNYMIFHNDSRFINSSSTGYAVIAVEDQLTIHNNTYLERMSGGEIRLHCDESAIVDDNSETAIQWSASVLINASDTYLPSSESCFGGYGSDSGEPDQDLTLEHVTKFDSPDIERISATSIDFKDGYAFVSWHERGDNYQGYIDVVDMTTLEIKATLYTTELDFNHMYVSPGEIYVTGGSKNGAFYSSVDYSLSASSVDIVINSVEGASGNCIIQDGGVNWVVSGAVGGVTRIDDTQSDIFTELQEAKFVTKYGDNMAVLAGVSPADATIYEFDTDGGLISSYEVGQIPTVDGKNTLFADGDDIYASLGEGGLQIFNSGSKVRSFENVEGSGSVNCVAVDDNYIYIANGVAGLYILDKETLEVLKTYQLGETSANYVKLGDNGLIYVAYGLDGVHVFKLKNN